MRRLSAMNVLDYVGIPTPEPMTPPLPIACTLTAEDYSERTTWIAKLNRESCRSHHQDDLTLELVYDIAASAQVRELVRLEEECCAFLRFTLADAAGEIHLRIDAPVEARDSVGVLFAPFLDGLQA